MGIPRPGPLSLCNLQTPHIAAAGEEKTIERSSSRHFRHRPPLRLLGRNARGSGAVSKTLLATRSDGVMAFAARVMCGASKDSCI